MVVEYFVRFGIVKKIKRRDIKMSKQRVTKEDVRAFVGKVRAKALASVDEKYKESTEKAILEYMDKYAPTAVKLFNDGIKQSDVLEDIVKSIKDAYSDYCDIKWRFTFSKNDYDLVWLFKVMFKNGDVLEDEEACRLHKEWEDTKRSVNNEYNHLNIEVDRARDGNSAVKLLTNLGFDTSSILARSEKVETVFNKEALFVCGEKS